MPRGWVVSLNQPVALQTLPVAYAPPSGSHPPRQGWGIPLVVGSELPSLLPVPGHPLTPAPEPGRASEPDAAVAASGAPPLDRVFLGPLLNYAGTAAAAASGASTPISTRVPRGPTPISDDSFQTQDEGGDEQSEGAQAYALSDDEGGEEQDEGVEEQNPQEAA